MPRNPFSSSSSLSHSAWPSTPAAFSTQCPIAGRLAFSPLSQSVLTSWHLTRLWTVCHVHCLGVCITDNHHRRLPSSHRLNIHFPTILCQAGLRRLRQPSDPYCPSEGLARCLRHGRISADCKGSTKCARRGTVNIVDLHRTERFVPNGPHHIFGVILYLRGICGLPLYDNYWHRLA